MGNLHHVARVCVSAYLSRRACPDLPPNVTVYLDPAGHLWSPERAELHSFAMAIGMRREWFQDRPVLYHYDLLTVGKRRLALCRGAVAITSRALVLAMRQAATEIGTPDS